MKTILVIEDEECVRGLIREVLESRNCCVLEAGSVPEGMQQVDRADLILMDVNMPGTSGLEALRSLKASKSSSRKPVVLMSGLGEEEAFLDAETGAADYLAKPFSPSELVKKLNAVLDRAA